MLNVDSLKRGIVIDHIKAGSCMDIYKYLELDKLDCSYYRFLLSQKGKIES